MNRKREKESYDRIAVGMRIQERRTFLNITQDELAERVDRATNYISEIERGLCGMSIETMLSFAKALDMSLDYMMLGIRPDKVSEDTKIADVLRMFLKFSDDEKTYAFRIMKSFKDALDTK